MFVNATKATSIPSTFPIFQFGSELADATRGMRFAIATAPETRFDSIFMETVSVNRDLQFKVFDSADTALVWLMERPNKTDIGNGK